MELTKQVTIPEVKEIPIKYGFSVEELASYNKLPPIDREGKLYLDDFRINALTGLNGLPNIATVKFLSITENPLTKLSAVDLKGLNNLENLILSVEITAVPENLLEYVKALTSLSIDDSNLHLLPNKLLNRLKKLRAVSFSGDNLEKIPEAFFKDNDQLVTIYLMNNQLKMLPKNIFKGANNLGIIRLLNNQFTEFPVELIKGLNLRWLDLASNPLIQANKDALKAQLGDKVQF